ncbi:unnamed protein product [Polarella glacialis]|uniref:Uncharacterized protein n=1 Tax=Polarella glacialis TaxID=89957 RepID=A0A813DHY9_POLGL|nr:unnamed protein product [Polarella glacialis]
MPKGTHSDGDGAERSSSPVAETSQEPAKRSPSPVAETSQDMGSPAKRSSSQLAETALDSASLLNFTENSMSVRTPSPPNAPKSKAPRPQPRPVPWDDPGIPGQGAGGEGIAQMIDAAVEKKLGMMRPTMDEQRIETLIRKNLEQQGWAAASSRPTTAPTRPMSSSQQASRSPQSKATWASSDYWSLSDRHVFENSFMPALEHQELEASLADRVFSQQPDRRPLGVDEVLVRDVVNSVVREIVGIFDALLDRLLIDKKQDTLRNMVVELMTEDISSLIASGREQLKQQELGFIIDEMGRLNQKIQHSENTWEKRFLVTGELGQALDDTRSSMDQRCASLEDRLRALERDSLPRVELAASLKEVSRECNDGLRKISEVLAKDDETSKLVKSLQDMCHSSLAPRLLVEQAEARVVVKIERAGDDLKKSLDDLRGQVALEARVKDLELAHDKKLKVHEGHHVEAKSGIAAVEDTMKKLSKFSQTCASKVYVEERAEKLDNSKRDLEKSINLRIDKLDSVKATRAELEEVNVTYAKHVTNLKEAGEKLSSDYCELTATTNALQTTNSTLATKEYAYEVANKLAHEVVTSCGEKEEVAALRREFAEERERVRQSVRQQQHNRQDINGTIGELQEVRVRGSAHEKKCRELLERIGSLESREGDHWERNQHTLSSQVKSQQDLTDMCKLLHQELTTHTEAQNQESERLRDQTTHRYLEQMDKALGLQGGIDKLSESLRTHLPKVA